jgi:hypothetical protein
MSIDIDAAVEDIGASLGFGPEDDDETPDPVPDEETPPAAPDAPAAPETPAPPADAAAPPQNGAAPPDAPALRAPPKSWAKEQHERWGKIDPAAQEYIEKREKDYLDGTEMYKKDAGFAKEVIDILMPYRAMYNAEGISPTQAVARLANIEYKLRNGSPEERMSTFQQLGRELGIVPNEPADPNAPPPDPLLGKLTQRMEAIESERAQERESAFRGRLASAQTEIAAFRADPKNEHFDEVAVAMKPYIEAGYSLQDAYDAAVHANPVTREKVFAARLTAAQVEREEKSRKEAEDAIAAKSANIKGAESRRTPTETKGKFLSDDELRSDLKRIKERAH